MKKLTGGQDIKTHLGEIRGEQEEELGNLLK
jgi:hypothetical protein